MSSSSDSSYVLVVGATGATGKFVVQQLLDQGRKVKVIVRSQSKLLGLLKKNADDEALSKNQLIVKETPSLLSLPTNELSSYLSDCNTIVQCLGHTIDYQGMFKDGYFVTESVERLTSTMTPTTKFILMGSEGVHHPDGQTDSPPTFGEKCVYFLLRLLIKPHVDNERAAAYLYENCFINNKKHWVVVRPTNLIDTESADTKYEIVATPTVSPIFGDGQVARANVAHFMTQLVTDPQLYDKYNHTMPCIYDIKKVEDTPKTK